MRRRVTGPPRQPLLNEGAKAQADPILDDRLAQSGMCLDDVLAAADALAPPRPPFDMSRSQGHRDMKSSVTIASSSNSIPGSEQRDDVRHDLFEVTIRRIIDFGKHHWGMVVPRWKRRDGSDMTKPLDLTRAQILAFRANRAVARPSAAERAGIAATARHGQGCRTACRARRCSRSTPASREPARRRGRTRRSSRSGGRGSATTSSRGATRDLHARAAARRGPEAPRRLRARRSPSETFLDGRTMTFGEAGRGLGEPPNRLRYAAPTGRVLIRWDGARQPTIWTVDAPEMDPFEARLELARRYLHVFGPVDRGGLCAVGRDRAGARSRRVRGSRRLAAPVRTPIGKGLILERDEPPSTRRPGPSRGCPAPAERRRVLPALGARSRAARARGRSSGPPLDDPRLAGRRARARRRGRDVAPGRSRRHRPALASPLAGRARRDRGRGDVAAAAGPARQTSASAGRTRRRGPRRSRAAPWTEVVREPSSASRWCRPSPRGRCTAGRPRYPSRRPARPRPGRHRTRGRTPPSPVLRASLRSSSRPGRVSLTVCPAASVLS